MLLWKAKPAVPSAPSAVAKDDAGGEPGWFPSLPLSAMMMCRLGGVWGSDEDEEEKAVPEGSPEAQRSFRKVFRKSNGFYTMLQPKPALLQVFPNLRYHRQLSIQRASGGDVTHWKMDSHLAASPEFKYPSLAVFPGEFFPSWISTQRYRPARRPWRRNTVTVLRHLPVPLLRFPGRSARRMAWGA